MQKKLGHHVSSRWIAFLPWIALLGVTGCGESGGAPPSPSRAEPAIDAGLGPTFLVSPRAIGPDPVGDAEPNDVADAATADSRSVPDAAVPRCVPEGGPDEPDETFSDTDCDGIDGNAEHAVFVAPTGSDSGAGTKDQPFKTIGRAVLAAAASSKSAYVCNGEYAENVRIEQTGVRIYGGYDCEHGWQRGPDRARVVPPTGVPLVISDVADPVVIDRLSLRAPDADSAAAGTSSIAASVLNSVDVLIRRSVLRSGDAGRGADGEPAVPTPEKQPIAAAGVSIGSLDCVGHLDGTLLQGSPQTCLTVARGGYGERRQCSAGDSIQGGAGGDGANVVLGITAHQGASGLPSFALGGTTGADGTPGAAAVVGFGRISSARYVAEDGRTGVDGNIGKAGVGGKGGDSIGRGDLATTFWIGGGGGQGGYPGCGGSRGNPGKGGGGSFAILSDRSRVRVERSLLETGRGGDGGNGSQGAPGQLGGDGGPGGAGSGGGTTNGQTGEAGGNGGRGGAGGPGGGGPSSGIVWTGTPPTVEAVTFVLGTPGLGGVSAARIGAQGVVAEIHPPVPAGDAGQGGTP
jgi:hypothetical protein